MEEEKYYTVYQHICPNQKSYIGITKSNVAKRWGKQGNGYKGQVFYNAIKKYGWENIEHKILYTHLTQEQAIELEIALIKQFKTTDPKYGYNISTGGKGVKEHYNCGLARRVNMYDIDGTLLQTFPSCGEAGRATGFNGAGISHAAYEHKTYMNYVWLYEGDNFSITERQYNSIINRSRKIYQYDLNGNYIRSFDSAVEAKRETGIYNISKCLSDEYNNAGGYIWTTEYKEIIELPKRKFDGIQIIQYDLMGNIINIYDSVYDIIELYPKCQITAINKCCNRQIDNHCNFIFRYSRDIELETYGYIKPPNPKAKEVSQYDKQGNLIKTYPTVNKAIDETKIIHISECANGLRKTAGGYIWRYRDEVDVS